MTGPGGASPSARSSGATGSNRAPLRCDRPPPGPCPRTRSAIAWTMATLRRWLQIGRPAASATSLVLLLAAPLGCQQVPDGDPTDSGSDESESSDASASASAGSSATGATSSNDSGSPLPEYLCDPADITTCPDGEKCTALLKGQYQNHYECVPDDGVHGLFDTCSPSPLDGQDGCSPGTYCGADSFDQQTGLCVPLCKKDPDCTGSCVVNAFDQVPYCGDACDPTQPNCPAGLQCRRGDGAFACSFFETAIDIGEAGAQCFLEHDIGCREGYVCLPGAIVPDCASPTEFCCTAICDQDLGDTCSAPASCKELFTDPDPGYEWVGACYVPA